MKRSNLSIMIRLGIGFGALLLMMAVIGVTNLYFINKIDHNLEVIVGNSHVRTAKSYEALMALKKVQYAVGQSVLSSNQTLAEQAFKDIRTGRQEYQAAIAELETLDTSDSGKALVEKLKEATAPAAAINNNALELENAGHHDEAIDILVHEAIPASRKSTDAFTELLKYQQEHMRSTFNDATAYGRRSRLLNILFGIASTLIGIVTAIIITRSIKNSRLAAANYE